MSKNKIYSPNKGKNFYSLKEILNKIFFSFSKKKKIFHELLYLTFAVKIYHKISSKIILYIINKYGFEFFNESKILRYLLFSGIRGMSLENIFQIRNKHFQKIIQIDNNIEDIEMKKSISQIRKDGFSNISNIIKFEESEVKEVNEYFRLQKMYNGHDPMQSDLKLINYSEIYSNNVDHEIFNKGYFSFDVKTSLSNQVIKNLFFNKKLKKLADLYCGFETEPYTISTMLNIKKEILHPVAEFHRDTDDFISLGFFIYWSETNKNNRSTCYKTGTHLVSDFENAINQNKYIEVKAGTIVAGDWMGLHRGNQKMEESERLITMIRYGKKINQSYMQTKSYYFF